MAGINVTAGRSGRRSLDSEINMIPMIDLLMVTISFLLITAVWTHMARVNADAQVPGPESGTTPPAHEKRLHVEMRSPSRFVLLWKEGNTTVESIDVERHDITEAQGPVEVVRFPDLASRIASEWKAKGQHTSLTDPHTDQAVLHTDNHTEFKYLVGVMDAIYATHRDVVRGAKREEVPAFNIEFAVD
jgi:biopolymer transport protein ExbD